MLLLHHRKAPSKTHPNEESSWVLPAHTGGNVLPHFTQVSPVQEKGLESQSWLQQGGSHHQPGQRETESHAGTHRLSPARKGGVRQELQLREMPKDHNHTDLFLTVPAPGQLPPGVSPAPQSAQSWGWAHWAVSLALSTRLLTLAGYWSHNVSECQSGLSFDHYYNQIQHSSMDY